MVFNCTQCGKCCMCMGDYIEIERQISPFEFACCSVSTGTPFVARVDEDKRELFLDRTWSDQHPAACRFLRPDRDLTRCTIHETSPPQCKFYRCIVMRVFDSSGMMVGTVTGTLALHSDDPELRRIWEKAENNRPRSDSDAEEWLQKFLEAHGYFVE